MTPVVCPECQKEIPYAIKDCPNCGHVMAHSKRTVDFIGRTVLVVIVLVIVFSLVKCSSGCSFNNPKMDAYICATHLVKSQLKSPSSANISSFSESSVDELENNQYMISGTVEADNSFGAKIKQSFLVTLTLTDSGYRDASVSIY